MIDLCLGHSRELLVTIPSAQLPNTHLQRLHHGGKTRHVVPKGHRVRVLRQIPSVVPSSPQQALGQALGSCGYLRPSPCAAYGYSLTIRLSHQTVDGFDRPKATPETQEVVPHGAGLGEERDERSLSRSSGVPHEALASPQLGKLTFLVLLRRTVANCCQRFMSDNFPFPGPPSIINLDYLLLPCRLYPDGRLPGVADAPFSQVRQLLALVCRDYTTSTKRGRGSFPTRLDTPASRIIRRYVTCYCS